MHRFGHKDKSSKQFVLERTPAAGVKSMLGQIIPQAQQYNRNAGFYENRYSTLDNPYKTIKPLSV